MSFQDRAIKILASIVFGLTALFLVYVATQYYGLYRAHLNFSHLFQLLESILMDPGKILKSWFFSLWVLHWFALWSLMMLVVEDTIPKKVLASSLFVLVIVLCGALYSSCAPAGLQEIFKSRFMKEVVSPGVARLVAISFLPLIGLNTLLVLAYLMGFRRKDLFESASRRTFDWNIIPKHNKWIRKALKKNLTYLGFEISKRKGVLLTGKERNEHVQIVGTTGSGKTRYLLFPMIRQDIRQKRGVIVIDAKGSSENAEILYDMAVKDNRAHDFRYFSMNEVEKSFTYNPLQHGNASQLKDKIVGAMDWTEPYYLRVSEAALQALFMDLESEGKRVTLPELLTYLKKPDSAQKKFFEVAQKNSKDIGSLAHEIELLVNNNFGCLLAEQKAEIDFLDVYQNNRIVYFALDTQSFQNTAKRFGRMVTQDLNALSGIIESGFKSKEKRPLSIYIDEFQAFASTGFLNTLIRGRSSGFRVTLAHQSLGDLTTISPSFSQQVLDNTNTKIFLRVNDPGTAQTFADLVGTAKTTQITRQITIKGQEPENVMGTERHTHQYLIHPDELKNLETGQAVFKSFRRHGRMWLYLYAPKQLSGPLPVRRELPKPVTPKEIDLPEKRVSNFDV